MQHSDCYPWHTLSLMWLALLNGYSLTEMHLLLPFPKAYNILTSLVCLSAEAAVE